MTIMINDERLRVGLGRVVGKCLSKRYPGYSRSNIAFSS